MGGTTKRKPSSAGTAKAASVPARSSSGRAAAPTSRDAPKQAASAPGISTPAKPETPARAATRKTARALPVRSSPIGETQSLRASLEKLHAEPASRKAVAPPARSAQTPAPFVRKPVLQELEARLLLSADLNPAVQETLLAAPALQGAEFRALAEAIAPTVVTSAQVAPIQRAHELVFVDTATPEYQTLVEAMREAAAGQGIKLEFVLIDAERDGIRKITDTLAQKSDLDAIHIISHAADGAVQLGSMQLDFDTLLKRAASIKKWGEALTENGDILFYGCDLAATERGQSLMQAVARLTGADVAASEDKTGAAARGGDWELEFRSGKIDAQIAVGTAAQAAYDGVLANVTVSNATDAMNGNTASIAALIGTPGADGISLREAITAANNTGGADAILFNIAGAGVHTIVLSYDGPDLGGAADPLVITDALTIDGTSQPSYAGTPLIEINGVNGAGGAPVLTLTASNSVIQGLAINRGAGHGILIDGGDNNVIRRNFIGTNAAGNSTAGFGNAQEGIQLQNGASGNLIGGAGAGNIVAGNNWGALRITGAGTDNNVVQGNWFGTNSGGANLGNGFGNAEMDNGASGNTIGGVNAGEGNVIAFADDDGVLVYTATSLNNAILGNSIHSNDQEYNGDGNGIDLNVAGDVLANHEATANDGAADGDTGPNNLQNFPSITGVTTDGTYVRITGSLATAAGTYRVEFFSSPSVGAADGYREGRTFLGFANITKGAGNFNFDYTLRAAVAPGAFVTATATRANSTFTQFFETSEFSQSYGTAAAAAGQSITGVAYHDVDGDADVAEAGTLAFAGATVYLYQDTANAVIDGSETLIGTATIDASGNYGFIGLANGTYYVVVDSKTLAATGYNAGSNIGNVWAEETYAVSGAWSGAGFTAAAGAVYGGQDVAQSDNAAAIATAEHVVRRTLTGTGAAGVNLGFSFNAVVNIRGDTTDDDASFNRLQQGSLRQFIQNSNAIAGVQSAEFQIGAVGSAQSIALTGSELPTISDAVTLDAWTQGAAGYNGVPLIELNGNALGAGADGLTVTATNGASLLRGFVINRFTDNGILLSGATGVTVQGSYIGTNTAGNAASSNNRNGGTDGDGIRLLGGSGNTVGGLGTGERNVISGNDSAIAGAWEHGVFLWDSDNNVIQGNYIGTNAAGTAAIRNFADGIGIDGSAGGGYSNGNVVRGNLLSGNKEYGIWAGANSGGQVIQGNLIGTNFNGTLAVANGSAATAGIRLDSSGNTVGGTAAAERNVISGNVGDGIVLTGNAASNVIRGNYIGTDANGTADLGNGDDGIEVSGDNNTIGGTGANEGNLVSGNQDEGVDLNSGASGNRILGNLIGTNAAGNAAIANSGNGVQVGGANNTVGGTAAGARNVISANGIDGVRITGATATGNVVQGNYIGLDAGGTADLGNGILGIELDSGAASNTIGGTVAGARNVISGNRDEAIYLNGSSSNLIQGNYLGTDWTGNVDLGNGESGIWVSAGSASNTIGGTVAGAGNLISGNNRAGIEITDNSDGTVIRGNLIGTNAAGTGALGNTLHGIWVSSASALPGSSPTTTNVGGILAGEGNTIAFNGGDGVLVSGAGTAGVGISGNSIHSNGELGIDLVGGTEGASGWTANDAVGTWVGSDHDPDTGPNALQNYPNLSGAVWDGATLWVSGVLESTGGGNNYRIHVYASSALDVTGHGEGERYLGNFDVVNVGGTVLFNNQAIVPLAAVVAGDWITVTATALTGVDRNTSEFSTGIAATATYSVSGRVSHDMNGDSSLAGDSGQSGVTVYLFQDGTDGVADGIDDVWFATTTTDVNGDYTFTGLANDTYWVVVDSKTFSANPALWAEQTRGAAGALQGAGFLGAAGALYGGRNATVSDNASALPSDLDTAEHVTRVVVSGANVANVDSAFSFNVVVNVDGDTSDDDGVGTARHSQGTLDQFILNANNIAGANDMRFVPGVAANAGGGTWWQIGVTSLLPQISGANTAIDGTAWSSADGTVQLDTNAGNANTATTVGTGATPLAAVARPELEIVDAGGLLYGLQLSATANSSAIRDLAIYGFGNAGNSSSADINVVTASAVVIEDSIVGMTAAGADPGGAARSQGNAIRLDGADNGFIQDSLIGYASRAGVEMRNGSDGWLIQSNEIRANGQLFNDFDGINLVSGTGTMIRRNLIADNRGPGIDLANQSSTSTVEDNTITRNALAAGTEQFGLRATNVLTTSNNLVQRNIISDNVGAGVLANDTVAPDYFGLEITRNSIFGNTGLGIDLNPPGGGLGDGVTANDVNDGDAGPNGLQNFPVLSGGSYDGATLTVSGTLNSTANTPFRIEFFASSAADPSGAGEGSRYLGSVSVSTPLAGNNVGFNFVQAVALNPGEVITATATNTATGQTSEFSAALYGVQGTVYEDDEGDGAIAGDLGRDGVTVRVYRDNGATANLPDATDSLAATTTTYGGGTYWLFAPGGTNFVTVDSRTVTPGAGYAASGFVATVPGAADDVWADQTYGVAGAMNGAASFLGAAGTVYGGRDALASDNAAALTTSDHVTRVTLSASAASVDSAFSFSTITNNRGNNGDDAAGADRMQQGSLRQFILNSNAIAGVQTSNFSIGGGGLQTIAVSGAVLPSILNTVILDATTQEGFGGTPLVELTGGDAISQGLTVTGATSSGSTIRGFIINDFTGNAIRLFSSNNVVAGNFLGTDSTGTVTLNRGNAVGVYVQGGANNTIGGTTAADRNVISGNTVDGIQIDGSSGNVVRGNYIGTDVTGSQDRGNTNQGVAIYNASANNTVGGTAAGAGNVISGNDNFGIGISAAGVTNNVVQGNYIGLAQDGTTVVGNTSDGIAISSGAIGTTVGGAVAGARNVISGNATGIAISGGATTGTVVAGNYIGLDAGGTLDRGNGDDGVFVQSSNNTIGGLTAAERNVIAGHGDDAVNLSGAGATGNLVIGNYLGTDHTGMLAVGNVDAGVDIELGANSNTVGGTLAGSRNVISGNLDDGIDMNGAGTNANVVQGNYIGVAQDGVTALQNGNALDAFNYAGVHVSGGAANNIIGGTAAAARNVISANKSYGVWLDGAGTTGNRVEGNYIGTDVSGVLDRGNGADGVRIETNASGNTVGGSAGGAGNVISGNTGAGITLNGSDGNTIQGNYVGTDAAGSVALANTSHGVLLDGGASGNTIGGTTAGARNVISGNTGQGVRLNGVGTDGNVIAGNYIGANATGTGGVAGGSGGIALTSSPANNTIGGTVAGAGNLIAYNATYGVDVATNAGSGNAVLGNAIHSNGTLGIDLRNDGVTANDADDVDAGPNGLQNFPVLASAVVSGGNATISGSLNSTASRTFRIEFFANAVPAPGADASGNGEGQRYLGFMDVTTDAGGDVTFASAPLAGVAVGEIVSATATDLTTGDTSEFAANVIAAAPGSISGTVYEDVNGNGAVLDDGVGRDGVDVFLYRDGGDQVADGVDDVLVASTVTAGGGDYSFGGLTNARYWVVVDSRDVTASAGAAVPADIWAEQTYGDDWATDAVDLAARYGGRNAVISDDAAGLATAEHVARAQVSGGNIAGVNFGFSFSAVVNTRGDTTDDDGGGGRLHQGSLRQFILNSNSINGIQTSDFSIGGGGAQTISPTAALPTITGTVILDATTQEGWTGAPIIELDGSGAGGGANGFALGASNSTIRGFVINRFSAAGIWSDGSNNRIAGNYIGVDLTGSVDQGNGSDGVVLVGGGADNTIGGTTAADRNVISGNVDDGVSLDGVTRTRVIGNYIGTNAAGTAVIGNDGDGVAVQFGSTDNTVGGTAAGERNVISGNAATGGAAGLANVRIRQAGTTNNVVLGNYIGTDATATVGLANPRDGVLVEAPVTGTTIGGTAAGAGNVISANTGAGINVSSATGVVIQGNTIGLDAAGAAALANTGSGVYLSGATNVQIGGTAAGSRNVISGNGGPGVMLDWGTTGTTVAGNLIGTDVSGTLDLGNGNAGVLVYTNATGNTIGGNVAAARNVISGNVYGVYIEFANNNVVSGNYIGLGADGVTDLGNDGAGVQIRGAFGAATGNTVGGTTAAERNVISGNQAMGIQVTGAGATGSVIQGNYIGTNAAGTAAVRNEQWGVAVFDADNTTIGGTAAGSGNLISGHTSNSGVLVGNSDNAVIQGNLIGTDATGTVAIGNHSGIEIGAGSDNALVGGMLEIDPNAGNLVAFSTTGDGIIVNGSGARILGNRIHSNAELGIDLGALADVIPGVTANDAGDGDAGANGLQNFPVIATANVIGAQITISGTLDSTDTRTFRVEFFASSAADPSNHGEGQRNLGFTNVTIAGGPTAFSVTLTPAQAVLGGEFVSATATDQTTNETSEFALCHVANTAPVNTVPATTTVNEDTAFAFTGASLISVADGQNNVTQVVLTVTNGTLAAAGPGTVVGSGTASVIITGTQADINVSLATLAYQGTLNYNGADTLTVVSTDAGGMTDTDSVAITVNPVNDAPTATAPASYNATEQTLLNLAGTLSVADVDAAAGSITVTVSVVSGQINAGAGGTGAIVAGSATSTVTITGTLAQVANVLAGNAGATIAYFNGSDTPPATDTLTLSVNDNGNTGGGALIASANSTINVAAVNDAPVNAVPASIAVTEDVPSALTGISIGDVDAGAGSVLVTLAVPSGTLAAVSGAGVVVGGSGSGTLTLSGTVGSINAFIAASNVTFTTALNDTSAVILTVTTDDQGNSPAPALNDVDTVTLNVTAVNDAPANTVPVAGAALEDVAAAVTGISIADVDAGAGNMLVTLSVPSGTLAAVSGAGVVVGGSGSGTLTLTGTVADINAFIAASNVTFTTAPSATANVLLTVLTDDQGNTPAPAQTDTDSFTIVVTAVNDAPAGTDGAVTVNEDATYTFVAGDFGFTDAADAPANALAAVRITTLPGAGTLFLVGFGNVGAGQTITLADITAGNLRFTPAADANGAGYTSFTFQVQDDGGTVNGGVDLDPTPNTMTVNVTALNDAPVNAVPGSITVTEDVPSPLTGISIADVDAGAGSVLVTLAVPSGTLAAVSGAGVVVGGSGSGTLTLTGTVGNINAFIAASSVTFTTALNQTAAVTLTVTTDDQGNSPAPALNDVDTVTLNVTAVNDAPAGTDATVTVAEDATYTFALADFGFTDPSDAPANAFLAVRIASLPGAGSLFHTVNGPVGVGTVVSAADIGAGLLRFTPVANANGAPYASFTFQVQDDGGTANGGVDLDSTPNTLTIDVTPVNDAPVGTDDAYAVNEDTSLNVAAAGVLANDTDIDGPALSTVLVSGPASAAAFTLNADGSFTYTPAANFNGTDSFTYRASDGLLQSGVVTVTITVNAINDAPANTVPGAQTGNEDVVLAIAGVAVNDADGGPVAVTLAVGNGTLTVSLAGGAAIAAGANGSATMTLTGTQAQVNAALATLAYAGAANWSGADTLTMTTTDLGNFGAGGPLGDIDTVALTINPVNDVPVIGANTFTINAGGTATIGGANLSATDIDNASGGLVFTVGSLSNGYFQLASNPGAPIASFTQAQVQSGQVQFVHSGAGAPAFTVTVSDGTTAAGPYSASITFNGAGVPLAPPTGGSGSDGGTTTVTPSVLPPVFPVVPPGLGSDVFVDFLRGGSGGGGANDAGGDSFVQAEVVTTTQPGVLRTDPVGTPASLIPSTRFQGDVIETRPLRGDLEVEPIRADSQLIPTRRELALVEDDPERQQIEIVMNSVRISGMALSVGAIWWAARAAGLVASLLASSPAWRHVDPLPVLGRDEDEAEEQWGDASEEDKQKRDEEHRAAWVLEGRES